MVFGKQQQYKMENSFRVIQFRSFLIANGRGLSIDYEDTSQPTRTNFARSSRCKSCTGKCYAYGTKQK